MLWPTRLQRRARGPLSKHPCRIVKWQEENLEHFLFLLSLYTLSLLVRVSALIKMYKTCSFMLQGIRLPQIASSLRESFCVRHMSHQPPFMGFFLQLLLKVSGHQRRQNRGLKVPSILPQTVILIFIACQLFLPFTNMLCL